MPFNTLGLQAELCRAVETQGYTTPTPVQTKAIPAILEGGDILAGAQTGTGKTAAFTLPMLQRLITNDTNGSQRSVRALVLTPTRELAAQVGESTEQYGEHLPLKSAVIFGGVNIKPQIETLRNGIDILIATPGRLLDHASQQTVDLSQVEILVLDEADRMLDMGFIHDIKKVLALLPEKRQNLLFSATYSKEIKQLARQLLNEPALIEVARDNAATETVSQRIHPVDRKRKRELLTRLIEDGKWQQVLVFTRTKHGANRLSKQLNQGGITAAAIHGNKSQAQRIKSLQAFKTNEIRVLVATDIAARGLDIDQLPHVVNYELPNVAEDYVHRIGRTGRAGNEGEAISLVCVDEQKLLGNIEKLIKRKITKEVIDGFAPDPAIKTESIPNGRNSGHKARRSPIARNKQQNSGHQKRHSTTRNNGRDSSEQIGVQVDQPRLTKEVNGNSIHYKPKDDKRNSRHKHKPANRKPREVAALFGG